MKVCFIASVILILILSGTPQNISAIEMSPKISDREIIESLVELKAGQKALQQQIADLKEGQEKLESRIDTLIYAVLGCFIALIGIVIWDRRTALSPAIKKSELPRPEGLTTGQNFAEQIVFLLVS